ncbi:MAG: flagellar assembly peptidoglycan hydrolase FlgJ [Betaproteobacteria bacterium]|nr:flagellar assembly peptidoglycan hydrolase FlgJ [Betaproteobacteria bacterium]
MINSIDISSKLAIDTKGIDDIRLLSKKDPDKALHEVAKQFESLFLHMLLKSMRDATPKDGILDSQQTQFYTQMYDQQLAQHLSSKGIGLADMMVQQLTQTTFKPPSESTQSLTSISETEAILSSIYPQNDSTTLQEQARDMSQQLWPTSNQLLSTLGEPSESFEQSVKEILENKLSSNAPLHSLSNQPAHFVNDLMSHAKIASQSTGIPAHFIIAQAALESGWGKHEIRHPDNTPSHNLFGIKAGANWQGAVVETVTTEYINNKPQQMVEKFRAYDSYAEGFQDYANLLLKNPRYAEVLNTQDAASFANGLQQAGYATDPKYADKLIRILNTNM